MRGCDGGWLLGKRSLRNQVALRLTGLDLLQLSLLLVMALAFAGTLAAISAFVVECRRTVGIGWQLLLAKSLG